MPVLLASLVDINTHLASGFTIPDAPTAAPLEQDAFNVILSRLSGVFGPAVTDTWVDPATTPDLINSIAARLIAAKWYMRQVNSDSDKNIPPYSMQLYNEAMSMLAELISGELILLDDNGDPIPGVESAEAMSSHDFWPNNTTPGPYFTMAKEWA